MLKQLIIENFQPHRGKLRLDFAPITTIVGPNDRGKSAILRALRWLCLNEEPGEAFISWGESKVKVRAILDEHSITRIKGNGTNAYLLDGDRFDAVALKVPEPVAIALQMGTVNFQDQGDSPFWFAISAPERSRELNQIVNLEVIDTSLINIGADIRKAKTVLELSETRLKEAKETRESLAWTEEANELLKQIEAKHTLMQNKAARAAALSVLIDEVKEHQGTKRFLQAATLGGEFLLNKAQIAEEAGKRVKSLSKLIKETEAAEKLAKTEIPDIKPLIELSERVVTAETKRQSLAAYLDELEEKEKELWEVQAKLVKAQARLSKRMKGKCPLCGQKLKALPAVTSTCVTNHQ